ncbi:MAG: hypothetical protein AB7O80_26670, partial [Acetobacteraceae bacterium]
MTACFLVSPFGVDRDSFPGGTYFITDEIKIEPLSDEHKSRLIEYLDSQNEDRLSKKVRLKPMFVVPSDQVGFVDKLHSDQDRNSLILHV